MFSNVTQENPKSTRTVLVVTLVRETRDNFIATVVVAMDKRNMILQFWHYNL